MLYLRCPVCDKLGKLSVERRPPESQYAFAVHCWSCADGPAPSPPGWLARLAQALGCRSGDLLHSIEPFEGLERGTTSNGGAPPPMRRFTTYDGLLDEGCLTSFRCDLNEGAYPWPIEWLERRGIKRHVWERAMLGWVADYGSLVIPYSYTRGFFKTRSPRDGVPTFSMKGKGRDWPLYVPNNDRVEQSDWCLLVEGETDALRAESSALPAVGLPLGAGVWREEWAAQLWHSLGVERVYVCLDVGAESYAERNRDALLGAGFAAEVVDLRAQPFGMYRKNADLSDWLNGEGSRRQLLAAIRRPCPV